MVVAHELFWLGLCGWLLHATHRLLFRVGVGSFWRAGFVGLVCAGVGLGIRLMGATYLASPTERAHGYPFAIAGGELVNGRWVEGSVGRYMPLPVLADLSVGVAMCVAPLAVVAFLRVPRRRAVSEAA